MKTPDEPPRYARDCFALVYDQALQKCILINYRSPTVETWSLALTPKK